jgi:choloylglycine hydrolase
MKHGFRAGLALLFFAHATLLQPLEAAACSRIFWNDNDQAMVVARTVDLFRSDEAQVAIFPRGLERDGAPGNPKSLKWKAKYGSVGVTAFGFATSDGMNEKGLSANLLYLDHSKYEAKSDKPAVSNVLWAQYMLDNYATVNEALASLDDIHVVPTLLSGREWPVHLSIGDLGGDSAIIEFVDGKMTIHHGKEYQVMTNEPAYDIQLEHLKKYKLFGGDRAMPGDIDPLSRFVRAASYLKTLPEPANVPGAAAGVLSVARTVAVPYGAEDTSSSVSTDTWPTLWFSIADLSNRVYYFQTTSSPNLYWVDLKEEDLSAGQPVRAVDAYDTALVGDVKDRLAPTTLAALQSCCPS